VCLLLQCKSDTSSEENPASETTFFGPERCHLQQKKKEKKERKTFYSEIITYREYVFGFSHFATATLATRSISDSTGVSYTRDFMWPYR
jgi:hypothetical protein